jgi:hypothetical protein
LQNLSDVVDRNAVGKSSLLRPLEEEDDDEDSEYDEDDADDDVIRSRTAANNSSSKLGSMFSVFRGLVGNKALTKVRRNNQLIRHGRQCVFVFCFLHSLYAEPDPGKM